MKPQPTEPTDRADEERHKQAVLEHYQAQLRRHGPTARGMDWKDEDSQRLRFALLCEIGDLRGKSVHEVGAGAGHLYDHLREKGIDADYSGSDLSAEMVEHAQRLHPGVPFERRDLLLEPPTRTWDVLVCSGLFHVKLGCPEARWRGFVERMLRRMFELCRMGIAFNLMSDQVDFRSDALYYANAGETLDFCRRELGRHVVLKHDYPLYEYTTYVYREPRLR